MCNWKSPFKKRFYDEPPGEYDVGFALVCGVYWMLRSINSGYNERSCNDTDIKVASGINIKN